MSDIRTPRDFIIVFALVSIVFATAAAAQEVAVNGSCEQVENGRPMGWGEYGNLGEWGTLEEGVEGRGVYFVPGDFVPKAFGDREGESYLNCAIVQGSSSGTNGADAIVNRPESQSRYFRLPQPTSYRVQFWIRTEASKTNVKMQGWRTDEARPDDRYGGSQICELPPTPEWTHIDETITLQAGVKKFALMFQVWGFEEDGIKPGAVYVDEVSIERVPTDAMNVDDLPRIEIPQKPTVYVGDRPIDEIIQAHRDGEQWAVDLVENTLEYADEWARRPDEWYRQFYKSFEPRGYRSVACPIHPFKTRYYNDFEWSFEEPWKLICPHCKAEGWKYYKYPNPDYPDDGSGCAPTDEVWDRTHDEQWSKEHRGIPHDHWDGSTHGDYEDSRRYYFLGKYYCNVLLELQGRPAQALAEAWHFATKLYPPDSEVGQKADSYAHTSTVIMLNTARAYLGDEYLAAAEGITPEQFENRMKEFYRRSDGKPWEYEKLKGFRRTFRQDWTIGDPVYEDIIKEHPNAYYSIYIGQWNWRASQARKLFTSFCALSEAFGDDQQDLRRICMRPVVSLPGDREKVAMEQDPPAYYLKRGCFEMEVHPYNLEIGGDNLASSTQRPKLRAAEMLRDDRIAETLARDLRYFWRNYFSEDGLGKEGAPSYSAYGVTSLMESLYDYDGDFDANEPYVDEQGRLNLFQMPVYKNCATKMLYYVTEDGRYIPWEDSVYRSRRSTKQYRLMEQYGGGVPERERKYLDIEHTDEGVSVEFDESMPLPPRILNDRRKAILRDGPADEQTIVSIDFTKKCGHYHYAVQDIMIHALGEELASDLGYLGSHHYLVRNWTKTYPAHNCLTIRAGDGNPNGTGLLRGDLRRHFATSPICQVVDTAEYDEREWKQSGFGEDGELSRQVILMTPSEDHQYVVDIARAKGGATHDLYFHCHGLGFETEGIDLTAVEDPDQNLYEYSGWSFDCGETWGAKNIHSLQAGESTGPWQATWSRIDDYRDRPAGDPRIAEDVFLRMWMMDEPGSEVIAGDGPAQRHFHNEDIGREMKIVTVRRENSETVNNFVSVLEPYRDEPFIKNVRRIPVDTDEEYTAAVVVEHQLGQDYIICYGGPGEPGQTHIADSGHKINTDGDVAVFSFPPTGEPTGFLAGGNSIGSNEGKLAIRGPAQVTGTLVDFDDTADTLLIDPDDPDAWQHVATDAVAGQPVIVEHREDRSTYTIASVEILDDGRVRLHLDDGPHLMQNWLLVRQVDEDGILVAPPPVLDSKRNTFKVYGGDPPRLLGPLRDMDTEVIRTEWGLEIHRLYRIETDDYSGVEPGLEIGISRLEKGHDTVTINRYAYSLTERTRTAEQLAKPKVLLIGDSISMGYSEPVKQLLKDRADVRRIGLNGGPTSRGLAHLDEWLGNVDWDIIHFNFGLHDTWYRNGKNRSVGPEEYDENLRKIVQRLQETGARLIWANTTPVPESVEPGWYSEDIVRYNEIAREIMNENDIAINDMYGRALERLDEIQLPDNIHFTEHGYDVLAEWVAGSIATELEHLEEQ